MAVALSGGAALVSGAALWLYQRRQHVRRRRQQETLQAAVDALMRTGDDFLPAVVRTIASTLDAELTLIGEMVGDGQVQTLAVARGLEPAANFTYRLSESSAAALAERRDFCCADHVRELFPHDAQLSDTDARGCVGVALVGPQQERVGVLVAVTRTPLADTTQAATLLMMFAGRAAAEIERARVQRELRKREEHLLQVQRVDAIGRLAGGVAHDFNNLLMIMIGYAEILRDREGMSTELAELLAAANRATTLTRQLLAFGRRQVLQTQRLDMNAMVSQIQTMLAPVIGSRVKLVTALDPALPQVEADPGQIEQVLVNLALNARDAMPDGGTLTLETRTAHLDRPYYQTPPGRYVCLEVSDTGIGMSPDVQAHIFEPFYTTKGSAGTGLGLSSVYGIVKQSGGFIWCASQPGHGTRFTIYLHPAKGDVRASTVPEMSATTGTGSERVLVVDDEPGVRRLLAHLLKQRGYAVHEAEGGPSALTFLSESGPVDLVVTDIVMPGMSGVQLADEISERWPSIKLMFVSGYSQHTVRGSHPATARIPVLGKPFTPARIATAVRERLDKQPPAQSQAAG